MALPPTVPTSFAPRPASAAVRRRSDLSGAFAFFGYGMLALALALAIGVFIYSEILATEQQSKDQELAKQVAAIDPSTVAQFVNLSNRLSNGLTLLNAHPALTRFWSALLSIMPSDVQFTTVTIATDDSSGVVTLTGSGAAKSFNALAATSDALATTTATYAGQIKDAIFSGIKVNGNAVDFTLSATIDPSLIKFVPLVASPTSALPAASTTL